MQASELAGPLYTQKFLIMLILYELDRKNLKGKNKLQFLDAQEKVRKKKKLED